MKNIYLILSLIISAFLFNGCNDDDYTEKDSEIIVTKSEVWFDSNPNTGSIEFVSNQAVTVFCDADWCTFTTENNTIKIEVQENVNIEGRSTYIGLKTSNGFETFVSIKQEGVFLFIDKSDIIFSVYEGGTDQVNVKWTTPITIEKTVDWIDYTYEDNIITVNTTATDQPRVGSLIVKSGEKSVEVKVKQVKLNYEDLLGNWKLEFINSKDEHKVGDATLTVNEEGKNYLLNSDALPGIALQRFPLIVDFNEDNGSLNIDFQDFYATSILKQYITIHPTYHDGTMFNNIGRPYIAEIETGGNDYKFIFSNDKKIRNGILSLVYYSEAEFLGIVFNTKVDNISAMTLTRVP